MFLPATQQGSNTEKQKQFVYVGGGGGGWQLTIILRSHHFKNQKPSAAAAQNTYVQTASLSPMIQRILRIALFVTC